MYSSSPISLQHADRVGSGSCPILTEASVIAPEETTFEAYRNAAPSSWRHMSRDSCAIVGASGAAIAFLRAA